MKLYFITLASIAFLLSCTNSSGPDDKQNGDDTTATEETTQSFQVNEAFPELYQYLHAQDSSFSSNEGFEGGELVKEDVVERKTDSTELKPYLPYLLYNSDSSFAIDLVTYNYVAEKKNGITTLEEGGPDFEVALINFKNNMRKRLLFFGTMGTIMDAKWVNDSTIVMAGTKEWVGADSLKPVIWKYEVPSGSWEIYTYHKMISADWSGYPKKWYDRKR